MKIALVRISISTFQMLPPMNLGALAAYLEKYGIETVIIDALKYGIDNQSVMKIIKDEKADAAGIGCMTAEYNQVCELSNLLNKNAIKVFIGGIHPTVFPYRTLVDSKADFVICGEGETAVKKLAENNFVNNSIPGVYSLENLKDESSPVQFTENIENLDELPFIWTKIKPSDYKSRPSGQIYKKMPVGYVMASRGCAHKCTFCASPYFYNGHVRMRSPENVIAEMKYLIDRCGVREIKFLDDNIALKKEYILKLCRLIGENIKVPWACSTGLRATSIDEEIVAALKKAGCYNFNIGVESGNDSILKRVCKQETAADYLKAVKLAKKYGMICGGFFIFGLPGETKETMDNTIKFAKDSDLDIAMFNILDVLPGSALWKELDFKFDRNNLANSYSQPRYLPDGLTSKDIIKAQRKALIGFYGRPKILRRLLPFLKLSPIIYVLERIFKKVKK